MLITDPKFDFSRTFIAKLNKDMLNKLKEAYRELESYGKKSLESCGVPGTFHLIKSCDMRYLGQGHEINVPVLEEDLNEDGVEQLKERFNEEYKRNYGYVDEGAGLEVVNLKLVATCQRPAFELKMTRKRLQSVDPQKEVRKIYVPEEKEYRSCPVYDRDKLYQGFKTTGPAIVEEKTSCTIVLPGDVIEVDDLGNLVITLR